MVVQSRGKMKIRCAWCVPPRTMGEKEPLGDEGVTDGICDDCLARYFPTVYEKCRVLDVSEADRYENVGGK